MSEKVTSVEPEIIEDELLPLSQADKWVSKTTGEVNKLVKLYGTIEVKDAQSYRDCKNARTNLRKDIANIEQERKNMTRMIEDVIANFKHQAQDVLEPLNSIEAQYKQAIDAWDEAQFKRRRLDLEAFYEEFAPALVPLVPFQRIYDKYATEKKWHLKSTSTEKCRIDLEKIVTHIAEDEHTISQLDMTEQERQDCRDKFFQTLDCHAAIQEVVAKRERMAALDDLDAMRAEQSQPIQQAQEVPTREPNVAQTAPQQATDKTKRVLEIEATQAEFTELISWLIAHNIHGILRSSNNG